MKSYRTLKKKLWNRKVDSDGEVKYKIEYNINYTKEPDVEPTISISKISQIKKLNKKDNGVEGFVFEPIWQTGQNITNKKDINKELNKLLPEIKNDGKELLFIPGGFMYKMLLKKWNKNLKTEDSIIFSPDSVSTGGGKKQKNNKTKKRQTKRQTKRK